jgi:hypothetical protein
LRIAGAQRWSEKGGTASGCLERTRSKFFQLLYRVLRRVRTNVVAAPVFLEELEMFVRRMLEYDSRLKDEVYGELHEWTKANVGAGKSFPKSFLLPSSTAPFELMRAQAEEGLQAVIDREERMEELACKKEEQAKKAIKK